MNLPSGKQISISVESDAIRNFVVNTPTTRWQITCFRCGEQGHYKSECFHWRTRLCWHFANATCCDPNCSFAHGAEEMRTPWMPRCVRIVKRDGALTCLGCKMYGHTYKHCPLRADEPDAEER
jgi:hypothetical protein